MKPDCALLWWRRDVCCRDTRVEDANNSVRTASIRVRKSCPKPPASVGPVLDELQGRRGRVLRRYGPYFLLTLWTVLVAPGCGTPPFHGVIVDPPKEAPPLRLPDGEGGQFDLRKMQGRAVLVFFGYTSCPDICPATLTKWTQVQRMLGPRGESVRFVFVSVDPERDSTEGVREYVRRFDTRFVGLSIPLGKMDEVLRAWQQAPSRDPSPGSPSDQLTHSGQTYLVDRSGRIRVLYRRDVSAQDLATDLTRPL